MMNGLNDHKTCSYNDLRNVSDYVFRHRDDAACCAILDRSAFESFFDRAFPPLSPPSLPSATAFGFFAGSSTFGSSPVAWPTMDAAIWLMSVGFFGLLDRFRMS